MATSGTTGRIAVRLEGGIGDHLLGMRLLRFVRERFPHDEIVVYSDANGGEIQLDGAIFPRRRPRRPGAASRPDPGGRCDGPAQYLDPDVLAEMRSADLFLDAWGHGYFLAESCWLGVPFYEILASRPRLAIPKAARQDAARLLARWPEGRFLIINLTKHGASWLNRALGVLRPMLEDLLADPRVIVLAPVATRFSFAHWPEAERAHRERAVAAGLGGTRALAEWHQRIVMLPDLPIAVVAALIERAGYFVGVDNGIKHLAWALDVPRTVLMAAAPDSHFALRWCPDLHRVLLLGADTGMLEIHLAEAKAALTANFE